MAPGLLDSEIFRLQALEHVMRVSRTWDSLVSLLPKGGEAIWGNLDWAPEDDHVCASGLRKFQRQIKANGNDSDGRRGFHVQESTKYGRIISFSKTTSESQVSADFSLRRIAYQKNVSSLFFVILFDLNL